MMKTLKEIDSYAVELAKSENYHYFEDFLERIMETTLATKYFKGCYQLKKHFYAIYRENYKSIGGI